MWRKFKSSCGLLADVITILLVIPLVWNFSISQSGGVYTTTIFAALSLGILFVVFRLVRERIRVFKSLLRAVQIKEDVENIEKTSPSVPFAQILPSTRLLNRWADELDSDASLWASDFQVWGMNFYLDISKSEVTPKMQGHYFSLWKGIEAYMYCGSLKTSSFAESGSHDWKVKRFTEFRGWRTAVLRAHEKISDQLPTGYKLSIHSGRDGVVIDFTYSNGKIDKQQNFLYDGKVLTDKKTSQAEKIK